MAVGLVVVEKLCLERYVGRVVPAFRCLVAREQVELEDIFRNVVVAQFVVGGVVESEFILERGLEEEVGVEGGIELDIVEGVDKHVEVVVASLIPVGRHIGLGELQRAVEGAQPVASLELGFHLLLGSRDGSHLSDYDFGRLRVDVAFEFLGRLGQGGFVVEHHVGVVDEKRLLGLAYHAAMEKVGDEPAVD